jgi:hypothetical protein
VVEDARLGGTYVLLLRNSRMKRIRIGKLGVLLFGKGFLAQCLGPVDLSPG